MNIDKKVSVIIPVYNVEKYIESCILSACRQTYENIEILLIDDGSEDKSPEICRRYEAMDQRIRFVKKEHSGVSDTRNMGIGEASGAYITFLDADDLIDKNFVSIMLQMVRLHNSMLTTSDLLVFTDEMPSLNKERIEENFIEAYENKEAVLFGLSCGYACGKLFDRQVIVNHKIRFDPEIHVCEDLLFVLEYLVKEKMGLLFVREPLYFYRKQEESVTRAHNYFALRTRLKANEKMIKLLEEEQYPPAVIDKFREAYMKNRIYVCFDYFSFCHAKHIRPDKKEIRRSLPRFSLINVKYMKYKDRILYIFLRRFPGILHFIWRQKQRFKEKTA